MQILNQDKNGVGRVKGAFVQVCLDPDGGYLDCGIKISSITDCGGIISAQLIDGDENGIAEFGLTYRDILYNESSDKTAVLSKDEVFKMIQSLQDVYDQMD